MATVVAFSEFLFPKGTTGLLFVPGWDQGSLQDFSHPHPPSPQSPTCCQLARTVCGYTLWELNNTVEARYLELAGETSNSSKYLEFDITNSKRLMGKIHEKARLEYRGIQNNRGRINGVQLYLLRRHVSFLITGRLSMPQRLMIKWNVFSFCYQEEEMWIQQIRLGEHRS